MPTYLYGGKRLEFKEQLSRLGSALGELAAANPISRDSTAMDDMRAVIAHKRNRLRRIVIAG